MRLLCKSVFDIMDKWPLTLKNDRKRSFSYETKASLSFNPIIRICLRCPIVKKKEIIMCIHVCHNWRNNINFKKLVVKKAFLIKQKHQRHLSQWGEFVYGAQSWKKKITTCIHVFHIDRITLVLKKKGKNSFSYQTKASMSSIPIRRICLWCPIMKKRDYYVHQCLSRLTE